MNVFYNSRMSMNNNLALEIILEMYLKFWFSARHSVNLKVRYNYFERQYAQLSVHINISSINKKPSFTFSKLLAIPPVQTNPTVPFRKLKFCTAVA